MSPNTSDRCHCRVVYQSGSPVLGRLVFGGQTYPLLSLLILAYAMVCVVSLRLNVSHLSKFGATMTASAEPILWDEVE